MGSIFKKNILKIRGVQPPPNFSTQNSGGVATPPTPLDMTHAYGCA